MSTDLTVHGQQPATALTISDDQSTFTPQQVDVLRHMGVEGASDGDLAVFFHVVKRTGLDPFARQIHMIGRNTKNPRTDRWETKYTIQTGIDGFRLIGRRAANASHETISISAPEWAHEDGSWRPIWSSKWGHPVGARVVLHRNGSPFTAVAIFDEYKQTKRDGGLTSMWSQRPAGQIAKCAEALAWRMAFPQDLAGVYVEEEMQQSDRDEAPAAQGSERSGTARLRSAVPTAAAPAAEVIEDAEVVDGPPADPITRPQSAKLHALLKENGADNRDAGLAIVSALVGRAVASTKDLTKAEASNVIDQLEQDKARGADAAEWPEVAPVGGAS